MEEIQAISKWNLTSAQRSPTIGARTVSLPLFSLAESCPLCVLRSQPQFSACAAVILLPETSTEYSMIELRIPAPHASVEAGKIWKIERNPFPLSLSVLS
jgi:hypothetical protein